ncbi:MAG: hypothetical protein EXS16_03965 [Gemmataceae bacterium]|nr:hypothetical protein [Gemmataceae bacterium]
MTTLDIQQVDGHLTEILEKLPPGEKVIVIRDDQPVATIHAFPKLRRAPRFGTMRGSILHIAPDFDAIPEGFEEY